MRTAVFTVMVSHTFPMEQGVLILFSFGVTERHPLSAHGQGLAENKKQQDGGYKPTHGVKARRSWGNKKIIRCLERDLGWSLVKAAQQSETVRTMGCDQKVSVALVNTA
ncbi:MAG: hypothetical protein Q8M91_03445 [Polaromonas sp.]|nr:hypothetical protein [Polaromonas sp.]